MHLARITVGAALVAALVAPWGASAQPTNTDFAAALDALLKGCQLPRPIAIYFAVRRQAEAQQGHAPPPSQTDDTAEVLYLTDVLWRGNQVDFVQYEQRDQRKHWRMLVQFRSTDEEVFKSFYKPLNASRALVAKDSGITTGFLPFNGRTSVICQNSVGPWMTDVVRTAGDTTPSTPTAAPAPVGHPNILTATELTAVAGWNAAQWEALFRPLLAAHGGTLTCRPALLMHAFIPSPYDRLITDHSLICE